MNTKHRIIFPLDVSTLEEVDTWVRLLSSHVDYFKIGLQLIMRVGAPQAIACVSNLGGAVFLDGKINDIPNTVGQAARAIAEQGVSLFDVHASAGISSMEAAVQHKGHSYVFAVTVLTSLGDESSDVRVSTAGTVFGVPAEDKVRQFAFEALHAGMDGIICSPRELKQLGCHAAMDTMLKITPGVRPVWASLDDQKRVMTPG